MRKQINPLKALIVLALLACSVYFSMSSFTGYVVAERISNSYNLLALGLFFAGIAGAYFLLKR